MSSLNLFAEEVHQPFLWPAEEERGAVLLVHGFPGTPAEMRPIAAVLHEAGWTVQGILLPGFGSQIETLPQRRYTEWVAAAQSAVVALQQEHHRVLVVGFSMGGVVALHVAAAVQVDGLVLLAPFWQLGNWWQRAIWQGVKWPLRLVRPLKRANFADPRLREPLALMLSGVDLDDALVQEALRQLPMPIGVMDQLLQIGRCAKRLAQHVAVPTLVVQGVNDVTVRPFYTRQLMQDLKGSVRYVELTADHALTDNTQTHWPELTKALLLFVEMV